MKTSLLPTLINFGKTTLTVWQKPFFLGVLQQLRTFPLGYPPVAETIQVLLSAQRSLISLVRQSIPQGPHPVEPFFALCSKVFVGSPGRLIWSQQVRFEPCILEMLQMQCNSLLAPLSICGCGISYEKGIIESREWSIYGTIGASNFFRSSKQDRYGANTSESDRIRRAWSWRGKQGLSEILYPSFARI